MKKQIWITIVFVILFFCSCDRERITTKKNYQNITCRIYYTSYVEIKRDSCLRKEIKYNELGKISQEAEYDWDGRMQSLTEYSYILKKYPCYKSYSFSSAGDTSISFNSYSFFKDYHEQIVFRRNNNNSLGTIIIAKFNKRGKFLQELNYSNEGIIEDRRLARYDKTGNLKDLTVYKPDGSIKRPFRYKYDNGNLIEKRYYRNDSTIAWEFSYVFDKTGKKIKGSGYSVHNSTKTYYKISYNEMGDKSGWIEYNSVGKVFHSVKYEHKYNKTGKLAEVKYFLIKNDDNQITSSTIYEYDSHGRTIKEANCDSTGNVTDFKRYVYSKNK